jgi:hypothetical protein
MKHLYLFLVLLTLPALTACGGSDPPPNPAPDQCVALVRSLCARKAQCANESGTTQCEADTYKTMDCTKAKGVSPDYNQCTKDAPVENCFSALYMPPASCIGAILF